MPTVDPAEMADAAEVDDFEAFAGPVRAELAKVLGAHWWLCASEVDQGALRLADLLGELSGGQPVMAIGARAGLGASNPDIALESLGLEWTGSMMGDIRSAHAALADPPAAVQEAIDRWDPDRRARVIGSNSMTSTELFGRPVFGARRPEWVALEDKLAIEEVWRSAGVPTAPSVQVDLDDLEGLKAAHSRMAGPGGGSDIGGSVWAVDNSQGWHGGGGGTHRVRSTDEVEPMAAALADHHRVRVMPFVEGVACSIHGMVVPGTDGGPASVAVFRPAEMMTLRNVETGRFVYGRASTFWDPAPADREMMGETARRIGVELARTVGYRGAYTVDGVMGADGFVPTEVNPRYGAALRSHPVVGDGSPIDLMLLHLALVEGHLRDLEAAQLERWVLVTADRDRWMSGFIEVEKAPATERVATVVRDEDGRLALAEIEATGDPGAPIDADAAAGSDGDRVATVRWGSAFDGGLLMVDGGPGVETGPSSAPTLVEITEAVEAAWGVGAPPLEAATPVR